MKQNFNNIIQIFKTNACGLPYSSCSKSLVKQTMNSSKNKHAALEKGISLVKLGTSIEQSAKMSSIPVSTLRNKVARGESTYSKPGVVPMFTDEEEMDLVKWILDMEKWGRPQTMREVLNQVSTS